MNAYTRHMMADPNVSRIYDHGLLWLDEVECGWFPVHDHTATGQSYWEHYEALEDTEIGRKLNTFRADLVRRHTDGKVLDVGIGNGAFLRALGNGRGYGYDVDPKAIEWLAKQNRWLNPYEPGPVLDSPFNACGFRAVTFWDSLEHIRYPEILLERIDQQWGFVSIPIFKDIDHLLASKHFKPTEHYHYFTSRGFQDFLTWHGFKVIHVYHDESEIGREDVKTFVFARDDRE